MIARCILSIIWFTALLAAQPANTRIVLSGLITDPSGAAVPAIRVQLARDGQQLITLSGTEGGFRFEGLAAGVYELRCDALGFDRLVQRVRVSAGRPQELRVRLKLASIKEELTVGENEAGVKAQASRNADAISVERTMLDNLPFLDNNYLFALGRFLDPGTPGGSGATIVVDGMEMRSAGVTASAIQEIRINNNP